MATIGSALATPEAGWKRYDDRNSAIKYVGTWLQASSSTSYGSTSTYVNTNSGQSLKIKIQGDKFRIIASINSDRPNSASNTVKIDGILSGTFSEYNSGNVEQVLVFEKTGLDSGTHDIEIVTAGTFVIDAIDIDSTDRLLHPDEVTDPKDLAIGKRIRCHYSAPTSGQVGIFSNLGNETYVDGKADFIPVASSATPNGDFYYICSDIDNFGRWKMIADRNVQNTISWDVLNTSGIASGSGLPIELYFTSNLCTSGTGISSSNTTGYLPSNAFDGNLSTSWRSNEITPNITNVSYIGYKFNQNKKIRKITMLQEATGDAITSLNVQVSNDGANWSTIKSVSSLLNGSTNKNIIFINDNIGYLYWRLLATSNTSQTQWSWNVIDIEMMGLDTSKHYALTTRLMTGGTSSSDKDNEWDNYIVSSTLGGLITAGDNNVWNWNGQYSLTSATTNASGSRTVRGSSSVSNFNWVGTSAVVATTTGFRPILLIESLIIILNKSFILFSGQYNKLNPSQPRIVFTGASSTDSIPVMTSNTAPSGTASASSIYSTTYDAWKAFNNVNDTTIESAWETATLQTGWLRYDFPSPKIIAGYSVSNVNSTTWLTRLPKDWTFEASNDGTNWTVLDTQTGYNNWTASQKRTFTFKNTTAYQMYRINVTANNGDGILAIGELEMFEATLVSYPQPLTWQPISATLPSLDTFKSDGIDDLLTLERKSSTIALPMDDNGTSGTTLGNGKVFKEHVDLKKFFDIQSLDIE